MCANKLSPPNKKSRRKMPYTPLSFTDVSLSNCRVIDSVEISSNEIVSTYRQVPYECSHICGNLFICTQHHRDTVVLVGQVIDLTDVLLTPTLISSIVEEISISKGNIYIVSSRGLSKAPTIAIAWLISRGERYSSAREKVIKARGRIDLSLNDILSLEEACGVSDDEITSM